MNIIVCFVLIYLLVIQIICLASMTIVFSSSRIPLDTDIWTGGANHDNHI